MSFTPLITLTNVPRDNSSFTVTDATPTDNVSGWGSPNAPSGPTDITSLFGAVQSYGGTPSPAGGSSGAVSTSMNFPIQVNDGVNNFITYYGLSVTVLPFTISADGLTLTTADPNLLNLFDGVKAISLDGITYPVLISSIQAGSIKLVTPVTANATGVILYKYYIASIQALTINNGEAICVNGISLLPLEADTCVNAGYIFNNLMLKLSAEIAFNCGNISKAHEAALILSGSKPVTTSNCSNCG